MIQLRARMNYYLTRQHPIVDYWHDEQRNTERIAASERKLAAEGLIACCATLVIILFAEWCSK